MSFKATWELRADFAVALSKMYGEEVPAYHTLVEVSEQVNHDFLAKQGANAERLGSIRRVTAERHGAIRVGTPEELHQVAKIFRAFGMFPVGFYDLRDASQSSVPVVSTAFRPIDDSELAKNPFRVFTSMLAVDDPRFFNLDVQDRLRGFLNKRQLFTPELLDLAQQAIDNEGLEEEAAQEFIDLACAAFKLSDDPVDEAWYRELEGISAVAADIGGVSSTHINHLTPRVLDIDALYQRMSDLGITMIDEIQGPPNWDGPDILLRQTSFRALDEQRQFRFADGTVGPGSLRVRFGEVEQRGIALTPKGRGLYDSMLAEVDDRMQNDPGRTRVEIAREVWQEYLPTTEAELCRRGLGYFTFYPAEGAKSSHNGVAKLSDLIESKVVIAEPIVYEDFLPRSAAGIFQSNLTGAGSRDNEQTGTAYDIESFEEIIGERVHDPFDLYRSQSIRSLEQLETQLSLTIENDIF
ncbi:2-oxoadipate dioxygenase/decarboxylase [Corynebacterium epidermidicanis]|uniref:2-oxoadipate dioxygenase/decarboxylase n=1 Tax=Corynebacterium epidermidicanis TaxID=1050174 RepID=A0A0G3GY16_9CORY|nr:VOC family protein [Corynebacterium epidermidicanis]AKK03717.1 hypothetical protein CEPID_09360 [Corynebacterium epidermidicanis]